MKEGEMTSNNSKFFSPIYDSFLTLIYPQSCQICLNSVEKQADGYACRKCWEETNIFIGNETLCDKCGAFLLNTPSNFESLCRRCDDDAYDKAIAIGKYEKALLVTILNLKHKAYIPKTLSDLFYKTFLASVFQDADLITPIPLSNKRFAERGFNQAEILAENLVKRTGVAFDKTSLHRKVHTEKRRAGMDRKSRLESVKNVFEVVSPRLIKGKKILLIDDVFTSGASVSNCAKVLKKVGAEKVYVLTVARA